jgi:archaellin
MKQFIGSWKCEESKDTTFFWDAKSYGTGLEGYYKTVSSAKTVTDGKFLQGYDKGTDKSIYMELSSGNQNIDINATWFITETKYKYVPLSNVSNFEEAPYKIEGEFKSPDMFVETTIKNNKTTLIETYTRIK